MIRYNIRITYGDNATCRKFYYVHENFNKLSKEEQDAAFNDAVTELDKIYKEYGRFATTHGINALFKKFGFIESNP